MTLKREHVVQDVQNRGGVVGDQDLCHVGVYVRQILSAPPGGKPSFFRTEGPEAIIVLENATYDRVDPARRPLVNPNRVPNA